jgi:hypothetical protein
MESSIDIKKGQIYQVSNSRRVLTQIKKFTDLVTGSTLLLGADSMFGANIMDGRFKTFTVDGLIES